MKLKVFLTYILIQFFLMDFECAESVNYIKHSLNIIIKKLEAVVEETVTNTECGNDLKILIRDLIKRKKWALQMIDASAKIEPGILVGNVNLIGNYDECIAIEEDVYNTTIRGQYCTLIISPKPQNELSTEFRGYLDPLWFASFISSKAMNFLKRNMNLMKLSYGLCAPSTCSVHNMESIWSHIEASISPAATLEFRDILCDYNGKPPIYIGIEPLIFAAFGFYFCLILGATIYEIFFFDGDENSYSSYVCTLSLQRNYRKLFSTQVGEDNISCINGLKVLSMLWVILGHRFLVNAITPNVNSLYLFEWKEGITNMVILGSTVSVDTFLTISGLLLSYIYLRYTELKNMKINVTSFYMLRIFRLSPPLLAVILIYIAVLKYINDGPLWPAISAKLAFDCLFYGWTNLFYVNNFIKLTNQCLPQSWYLSVDSQLYFLFPLIFFSIKTNPRRTLYWMLFIGLVSSATSFLITIQYGYMYIFDIRYGNDIYQSTFLRMPVWLIGVATGYFVYKYKNKEFPISKHLKVFLWTLCLVNLNGIVFGQVFILRNESIALYSAIFNALGRPIWSLTISWIIFACVTKNGGIVNKFLSLPVFNFMAKITYSLYLVHVMVILVIAGRRRHIDHFNNFRAVHEFCGDAIFSLVVATCFSLIFESPLITLAKKVFRRFEENLNDNPQDSSVTLIKYKMWFLPVKVYTHTKVE